MMLRIGVIALGFAMAIVTAAQAFTIDQRCKTMRDPLACTCALQTGGTIGPSRGGVWWKVPKAATFAFRQCVADHGAK
jgi:hypothetical protein